MAALEEVLLLDVLPPVLASGLTAGALLGLRVGSEVATHNRLARYAADDLRRWIADRDRAADLRLDEIRQDAAAKSGGTTSSGALEQARSKVYKHVLHEYRDRGLRALRDVDELADQEGRTHRLYRRFKDRQLQRPRPTEDGRAIVKRWRDYAELDVSAPAVEPALRELEAKTSTPSR